MPTYFYVAVTCRGSQELGALRWLQRAKPVIKDASEEGSGNSKRICHINANFDI